MDVPHEWTLNCHLPPVLCNEALEQLYDTNSFILQAGCIEHRHRAADLFIDLNVCYMPELLCLQATGADLEEMEDHSGERQASWLRAGRELGNAYGHVFSLHARQSW